MCLGILFNAHKKSSKHLKAKLYCTVPLELQVHGQLDGFSAGSVIPFGSGCVGVIFTTAAV